MRIEADSTAVEQLEGCSWFDSGGPALRLYGVRVVSADSTNDRSCFVQALLDYMGPLDVRSCA